MKKLKKRWGIDSNWQIFLIILVFAITGTTSSYIGKPILAALNITHENLGDYLYWPLYTLIIFIVYQFLLVFFGWLFGQYRFFWNFEKRMLKHLGFKRFFKE